MKSTDISSPLTSRSSLLASALILACATPGAMAATGSWATTTAASGDWSVVGNWTGSIPTGAGDIANFDLNYGSNNRTVVLDGSSRTVGTLNMGDSGTSYWVVTIKNNTSSGSSGAGLILDNTPNSLPASLVNDSTNNTVVDIVECPVTLTSNLGVNITAKGTDGNSLTITGVVSGPGSITKTGTGGIQLSNNANSFAGGFTLTEGNLHLGGSLALGPGTFTINGGAVVPRGAARSIPNAVVLGGDFTAGLANIGNALTFAQTVNLGGARTITVADTTVANDFTLGGVVSNGSLTKAGAGTMVMSGTSSYVGATTVNAGTLILNTATNPIDTSTSVSVNGAGAKLVVGSTSPSLTTVTPTVTLSQGTVDGTGTINSLVVTNSLANIVTGGNGTGSPLQVNSLTFQGAATLNIRATGEYSNQFIIAPTLATASPQSVEVNMTNTTGSWITGAEYVVVDFNTYGVADASHFKLNNVPGLNPTQVATLINTGGEIVMRITGDTLKWTGAQSSDWSTTPVGGSYNWSFQFNPAEFSNGNAVTFDESGVFNFNVNVAQNVSPGNVVFENTFNAYTVSSTNGSGIQGVGALTKGGAEKLTITTVNGYTGATTINGGTLEIGESGSITASSMITNRSQLIFNPTGGTNNYANPITGAGAITKTGSGVLTLSGANTFTGTLVLSAGTLNLNSAGALGTGTSAFTIGGGTLDNSSAADVVLTTTRPQTWSGDFGFTGTKNLDMGSGNVTVTGSGTRTVTVNAGTLTVGEIKAQAAGATGFTKNGGGTLVFTSVGAGGGSSVVNGLLTVNGGTLQMNRPEANDVSSGDFTVNALAGGGRITNGAAHERWLIVTSNVPSTFNGLMENGGSGLFGLTKQGTESLTLESASTYTGPTRVIAGPLVVKHSNALGGSTVSIRDQAGGMKLEGGVNLTNPLLLSNDGTGVDSIGYAVQSSVGNNVLSGPISLMDGSGSAIVKATGTATLVIDGGVTNGTTVGRALILSGDSVGANAVNGVISNGATNASGVTKVDVGTWTLTGANTYTGTTLVNAGNLHISGSLDNTAVTINNGNLHLDAANAITKNTVTFPNGGTGTLSQVANAISGTAGLAVQRAVTLGTPNNYTGNTTINAGDGVALTVTNRLAAGSGRLFASSANGTLNPRFNLHIDGGGTIEMPNSLGSNTNVNTTVDVNNDVSGSGGLIKLMGVGVYANGTLNVTGGNGYNLWIAGLINDAGSGTTCTLNPTTANLTLGSYSSSSNPQKTLKLDGTSQSNSVEGVISNGTQGSVSVLKTNTSKWTLSGDNTYTGSTTVTEGTLEITKPVLADTSDVVIGAAGVLHLSHNSTDQVKSLVINGQPPKENGEYSALTDPGFITGPGKIRVGSTGGYSNWAASFPGFTASGLSGEEQDADGDGIKNVLEYVLGGIPFGPGASNLAILPVQSMEPDYLVLTFRRSDESEADTTVKVQWSTNLGTWNDFATLGAVSGAGVDINEGSPTTAPDTVTVRIPRANASPGQKLFGRVVATKP